MKPHPRIRKTAKWSALVLGVVMVVAGAVSTVSSYGYKWFVPTGMCGAGVNGGRFTYFTRTFLPAATTAQYDPTWYCERWSGVLVSWWPQRATANSAEALFLPFWIPSIAAFGLGAALWRWDVIATRRAKTGLCSTCSYDLSGISPTAPCPECGKAA